MRLLIAVPIVGCMQSAWHWYWWSSMSGQQKTEVSRRQNSRRCCCKISACVWVCALYWWLGTFSEHVLHSIFLGMESTHDICVPCTIFSNLNVVGV